MDALSGFSRERFRDELGATIRAVSQCEDITLTLPEVTLTSPSSASFSADKNTISIPLPNQVDAADVAWVRGEADALSLYLHYGILERSSERELDNALHIDKESQQDKFLNRMEKLRAESLGARSMAGVAVNLKQRWQSRLVENKRNLLEEDSETSLEELVALLAWGVLSGSDLPDEGSKLVASKGQAVEKQVSLELSQLANVLDDRESYMALVHKIYRKLYQGGHEVDTQHDDKLTEESGAADDVSVDGDMQGEGGANNDWNRGYKDEEGDGKEQDGSKGERTSKTDDVVQDSGHQTSGNISSLLDKKAAQNEGIAQQQKDVLKRLEVELPYQIYTNCFDEVVHAEDLVAPNELIRLREQIDRTLADTKDVTTRLVARLQRKLLASQLRSWEYNQEEGVLNPAQFTRLITDPAYPTPWRKEKEADYRHTVVTILLDNSGSMRGRPITITAICADILTRALERCGIRVEILGFTTKEWKGGQSRCKWQSEGEPQLPGRLNDLRHIIYKSASMPWRRAKNNLGLMLKEGILKENIDGEAVLWAYERLLARSEERRVLMVISDGAPIDDSTLATNPSDILDRHLRQVVANIESQGQVDLLAIGIGHDVTRYYRRAVMIQHLDDLGAAMVDQLTALFGDSNSLERKDN